MYICAAYQNAGRWIQEQETRKQEQGTAMEMEWKSLGQINDKKEKKGKTAKMKRQTGEIVEKEEQKREIARTEAQKLSREK